MNILLMTSPAPIMSAFSTEEKVPPLGIGSLMAVLRKHGHKVYFIDNYLQPSNILETDFLVGNSIDWVGIYINTVCFDGGLDILLRLEKLRENKIWNGKIMVGGPHTSVGGDSIPEFVDNIVTGEAEISILEVIEGTVTDRIVKGKPIMELDTLPIPAWGDFISLPYQWHHPWMKESPVYTLNTSRGCPFQCAFCSVHAVWGRQYRYMSSARILDDVRRMHKDYGMNVAYFREDHFTLNKPRVTEFCEGLIAGDIKLKWMCETRVDQFDDKEYIKLIKRAGCEVVYIGVESGSPRMLEFMKKGETVEQFESSFRLLRDAGIKTYASFVVGAPTETEEDLQLTLGLLERIKPDYHSLNVYLGLPGSEFYDYIIENELHEYKDASGIVYPKGYDKRVDRFYGGNIYKKIPTPQRIKQVQRDIRIRRGIGWRLEKFIKKHRLYV